MAGAPNVNTPSPSSRNIGRDAPRDLTESTLALAPALLRPVALDSVASSYDVLDERHVVVGERELVGRVGADDAPRVVGLADDDAVPLTTPWSSNSGGPLTRSSAQILDDDRSPGLERVPGRSAGLAFPWRFEQRVDLGRSGLGSPSSWRTVSTGTGRPGRVPRRRCPVDSRVRRGGHVVPLTTTSASCSMRTCRFRRPGRPPEQQ